jgi:hypothetical protein
MDQSNGSKAAARLDRAAARAADRAFATAPMYPARLTPVARAPRRAVIGGLAAAALALVTAACGGRAHQEDSYRHATAAQAQCCETQTGPARDQCLGSLVKVEDPAVASSSTNQATFECVEDHFECDANTGRATRASAQAQLDCIQDLEQ